MIDATNPVLCQAPKAFDSIGVNIAGDKDPSCVMNALMLVTHRFQRTVRDIFISENRPAGHCSRDDVRHQRCSLCIRNDLRDDPSFALDHTEHGGLASPASALMLAFACVFVLFEAAVKAFVHFDFARPA